MTSRTPDGRQLTLLEASLDPPRSPANAAPISDPPPPVKRKPLHQRNRTPLGAGDKPPPSFRAPRGDLFRELFEKEWAAALAAQPDMRTREQDRAAIYQRLSYSAVFQGKKKLKGPPDHLRRTVGSNRCAEFNLWLQKFRGVKGASVAVRYASVLSLISKDIEAISIDLIYAGAGYCDPAKHARARLDQARTDIAALQKLFDEMTSLYYYLRSARLHAASRVRKPLRSSPFSAEGAPA
jgi:hypothetical protein